MVGRLPCAVFTVEIRSSQPQYFRRNKRRADMDGHHWRAYEDLTTVHTGRMLRKWRAGGGPTSDEADDTLFLGMRLPWLMSHYMWPFIFSVVFMTALLSGITLARARSAQGGRPVYFHPLAVSEALVSITAGVLLWMGVWDLLDAYLVPREWWAKLFMLLAGGFALFSTRTLYDETHVLALDSRADKGRGSYVSVDGNAPSGKENGGAGELRPSTGLCGCCFRPSTSGSSAGIQLEMEPPDVEVEMEPAAPPSAEDLETGDESITLDAPTPPTMSRQSGDYESTEPAPAPAQSKPRRYFNRPAFSPAKCGRALFAVFAGLTMWVGLWDLVDQHILPSVFVGCQSEPSGECAVVKLGLIAVRARSVHLVPPQLLGVCRDP